MRRRDDGGIRGSTGAGSTVPCRAASGAMPSRSSRLNRRSKTRDAGVRRVLLEGRVPAGRPHTGPRDKPTARRPSDKETGEATTVRGSPATARVTPRRASTYRSTDRRRRASGIQPCLRRTTEGRREATSLHRQCRTERRGRFRARARGLFPPAWRRTGSRCGACGTR